MDLGIEWDAENRLTTVKQGGNALARFTYDGNGRGATKTTDGSPATSTTMRSFSLECYIYKRPCDEYYFTDPYGAHKYRHRTARRQA